MALLQRIVVDLRAEEMVLRVLYRSSPDGPNPRTALFFGARIFTNSEASPF